MTAKPSTVWRCVKLVREFHREEIKAWGRAESSI